MSGLHFVGKLPTYSRKDILAVLRSQRKDAAETRRCMWPGMGFTTEDRAYWEGVQDTLDDLIAELCGGERDKRETK